MKSNNFLMMCLISIGLYGSSVEASNPAYNATVNAKRGLGATYNPAYDATVNAKHGLGATYNPSYDATVNAKNGLGATRKSTPTRKVANKSVSSIEITGAPWTAWAKSTGSYYSNNTAVLKSGKTVHRFYDVKRVPKMSNVMYGSPYIKFAQDREHVLYGRPGISGVA